MVDRDFPVSRPFDQFRGAESIRPWLPLIVLVLAGMIVGLGASMAYFTVEAYEKAVVLRFGKLHSIRGPGLHFKFPLVDRAVQVRTDENSLALPYGIRSAGRGKQMRATRSMQPEPLILTGDLFAGVVEWNVVWRVVEPDKFLFSLAQEDVEPTIQAVARSAMNRVVGDYSADELLTGKREEIGLAALDEMQEKLGDYDCGIRIVALQMQRVTPPERVKPAFDQVNESIQQRDQSVNEANLERNKLIPDAEASRDRFVREAEGYAARTRAETNGEIAALRARYEAYKKSPEVTRQRLYLDAMEDVLINSGPKTILDADLKGLLPLLNLNDDSRNR